MFAAFLTTILFSLSAVCANRTTRLLGGIAANFWRLLLATALLAIWAHGWGTGIAGKAFPLFFASGLVGFGLGDLALYQALPRLGSRLSVILVSCLSAPVAAVMEWFWLGTPMSPAQIASGILILVGVAVALAPSEHLNLSRRVMSLGIYFGLLAALGQGIGAVMSRKAFAIASQAGQNVDGITAAYQRILGGVLIAGGGFVLLKLRQRWSAAPEVTAIALVGTENMNSPWRRAWPWVLLNGLTGPALGVSCYQWALKQHGTGVVLPIVAITPLVIIPFARYMEGERARPRSLIGGLIAVAGAVALAGVTQMHK